MSTAALDENLILQIGQGDGEAFRQLYLATSDAVYGFALSILKNKVDAEDAMHDAYIKIHQSAKSYQQMGKPMAWVLTIVKNLCYNKLKAAKPNTALDEPASIADERDTQQGILDRMVLEKALEVLDLQDRQIVVLHALTGLKHREIAEILELPEGTVMSKYNRALKKLRTDLERKGEAK